MARRPFMISGPEPAKLEPSGPEKAKACARVKEVGTAGAAGTSVAGSAAGSSEALTAVARRAVRGASARPRDVASPPRRMLRRVSRSRTRLARGRRVERHGAARRGQRRHRRLDPARGERHHALRLDPSRGFHNARPGHRERHRRLRRGRVPRLRARLEGLCARGERRDGDDAKDDPRRPRRHRRALLVRGRRRSRRQRNPRRGGLPVHR
mmetsp:Transcript_12261/g.47627  ORF Transcript_12261/g.47627 Transcript_12261/m.47627 type:complete len:210 (-) Transcript_12261:519-1148(-)